MTMDSTAGRSHHLLTPPTLDLSSEVDLQSSWRCWLERWHDYAVVTNLHNKSTQYRCSMLRYCFADSTRIIYDSLDLNCVERNDPEKIIYILGKFINDAVNHPRFRYYFHSRTQKPGESFDSFITDIRALALKCNFCEECRENSIRDQIVVGVNDTSVRQKLLECHKLSAKRAEELCRAAEKTRRDTKPGRNTFVKPKKDVRPCCESQLWRKKWDNESIFRRKKFESTEGRFLHNQECGSRLLCRNKSFKGHSDSDRYENTDLFTDDADSGMCTPGYDVTYRCDDVMYGEHRITPSKSSVKVVRRMITKCRESKNNILKGLQILRNTDKYEEKHTNIPERLFSKKTINRFHSLKNTSHREDECTKNTETSAPRKMSLKNTAARLTEDRCSKDRGQEKPIAKTGQRSQDTYVFNINARNNNSNVHTTSTAPKNPQQRQTLIADAMSRIFHGPNGHRHVTPRELIEETVTELERRKVSDEPETFIDHDILSCDELDSLPYDDEDEEEEEVEDESVDEGKSFNDRATSSSLGNDDDLSDTFEYDYDSQGSGTGGVKIGKAGHYSSENGVGGVKIGKTGTSKDWAEDVKKQSENEEYILTTYM